MNKGRLLLANGTEFEGECFGAEGTVIGEIVFTTSATGYQEALSDPDYHGQIVAQTFPLIGNYGTNEEDYISGKCHAKGYLVREWCNTPSNFRMDDNIDHFLKKHGIVGLCGIDTRRLTHILREHGVMNGAIYTDCNIDKSELLEKIKAYRIQNPVAEVTVKESCYYPAAEEKYQVAVMDYGCKKPIIDELLKRGCSVTLLPALTTAEEIRKLNPDGILLSDGPGNPEDNKKEIANLKEITGLGLPMFGVSLGHQLLALAMGGKTVKLNHGHRGASQPVVDMEQNRTFVTAQNHGYAVLNDSITAEMGQISHVNANDKTCEGIRYTAIPAFSVQFQPNVIQYQSAPESEYDRFITMMQK